MPYITHPNGQKTFYYEDDFVDPWKPHDTILIQHGFARSAIFWYKWVPVLAQNYRVIRRDARGHGKSSAPTKPEYTYDMDTILDEIKDTLDQLGLEKVHYIGESTGGIWGEFFAAKYPERLHSLAICSSPLYMPKAAQEMLAFGHKSWADALRDLGARGWGEEILNVLNTSKDADPAFVKWWLKEVGDMDGKGLGDHAELLCSSDFDARRIMNNIKVPMLMLTPSNSKLVNLDEQKDLHEAVKGSKQELIKANGHEIYLEPEASKNCLRLYQEFLQSLK
ncbi:alpha/beta-hydrolase [Rhizodiscina lignyota]|uniref:Alpha/beta-hydrolase n=1 Tax=Rhizodiscina lignyota TaxID=1504668 RepID=A0A9P4MA69_9PEZI|nr:alpha/beta-hydrolase [Rhizodiscina lignyota]